MFHVVLSISNIANYSRVVIPSRTTRGTIYNRLFSGVFHLKNAPECLNRSYEILLL